MNKKIFKILFSLTVLTVIFLPAIAFAQTPPTIGGITTLPNSHFADTADLVRGILNWLLGFTGIVAIFAIIYSGIMYMTAGGDTTKAETARKNLTWAITGIILVMLSLVIVNLSSRLFNTNAPTSNRNSTNNTSNNNNVNNNSNLNNNNNWI